MVSLKLSTRALRDIDNKLCRTPLTPGDRLQLQQIKRDHPAALFKPGEASQAYNCHGLTFASRRTAITNTLHLDHILLDDDYQEVPLAAVLPGDVVIYRTPLQDGGVEHSGVVVQKPAGQGGLIGVPLVLSKWGKAHEAIHYANYCPYSSYKITYFRVTK